MIDTPVLIAYRNGEPDAVAFFASMRQIGRPDCSQITALALIAWCQDALDLSVVQNFLTLLDVHAITAHTMRRAQRLLGSLPPPCGLTPDDAIIAATAIEHSLPLYTLDPARFANLPGLATIQPY